MSEQIPQEWKLTIDEEVAITDSLCKKYKTTWEEIVKGSLSATNLEQFIIDVYDTVADAAVAKCAPLIEKRIFEGTLIFHVADKETLMNVGEWAECQDIGVFVYFPKSRWQTLKEGK